MGGTRKIMIMKRLFILLMAAAAIVSCGKENGSKLPPPPDGGDDNGSGEETSLTVYGKVADESGKPFPGVVITDGRNFAVTGEDGTYRFEKYRYASFLQCSIPSEAVIGTGGTYNLATGHYKRLSSSTKEYDFIYARQPAEKNFRILTLGDPQVGSSSQVSRYTQTAVPDVRQYVINSSNMRSYAITSRTSPACSARWGFRYSAPSAITITSSPSREMPRPARNMRTCSAPATSLSTGATCI